MKALTQEANEQALLTLKRRWNTAKSLVGNVVKFNKMISDEATLRRKARMAEGRRLVKIEALRVDIIASVKEMNLESLETLKELIAVGVELVVPVVYADKPQVIEEPQVIHINDDEEAFDELSEGVEEMLLE